MNLKPNNFNTIANAFRRGEINNTGLNARLVKYRRLERSVTSKWGCGNVADDHVDNYTEDASRLADAWVDLVVDVACFKGIHLDKDQVSGIRDLLKESIVDSVSGI